MIAKIIIMNWKKDYLSKYVYCSWDTAPPHETTSFTIKISFFLCHPCFCLKKKNKMFACFVGWAINVLQWATGSYWKYTNEVERKKNCTDILRMCKHNKQSAVYLR